MPYSVKGKSAIVTGAGSGINLGFAKLLLENGANVLIADLSLRPEAKEVVEQYSGKTTPNRAIFQQTDVRDWAQLEALFTTAEKEFGEIDIVCPGAGIFEPPFSNFWYPPGSPESKDPISESRYALLDINLTHPIRTTQLAISHFLEAKQKRSGSGAFNAEKKHILHISSIAGQMPVLGAPLYVASKHAISGFVRSLAHLDEVENIRVTAVAPGIVKTPLWLEFPDKLKIVDESKDVWLTPDEIAQVMLALIQQDTVSEVIGDQKGQTIPVRGGTILEVSRTVREVNAFNDPGPLGRIGNTVSGVGGMIQDILGLLSTKGWGKPSS